MKTETVTPNIPDTIKALRARHNLSELATAEYLGVTVHALRKWTNGTRAPESSALRLIEVLGMVEALAPALHAALLPARAELAAPAPAPAPVADATA